MKLDFLVDMYNTIFLPKNILKSSKSARWIPWIVFLIFVFTPFERKHAFFWYFRINLLFFALIFGTAWIRSIFYSERKSYFILNSYDATTTPFLFFKISLYYNLFYVVFIWMEILRIFVDVKEKSILSLIIGTAIDTGIFMLMIYYIK